MNMDTKRIGLGLVGLAALLVGGPAKAATAGRACTSSADHACWTQVTYVNFKDMAVGNGLVCMVGGAVQPASNTDEYLHPNAHSPNQGNEDVIECHKPKGVSGFSDEPFYPGYGSVPYAQNRVPDGIYDDGTWGGTPTGVLALYGGADGDDIAVLTSKQHVYVAAGARDNFYSGGNYSTYQFDRKNINADTGATLCLKGLFSELPPMSSSWALLAHGCNGEVYVAVERTYRGWALAYNGSYKDVAGGYGAFYGLTSTNQVYASGYRFGYNLAALPAGTAQFIGDGYALSNSGPSSRVYRWSFAKSSWTAQDVGYPAYAVDELDEIDNGVRFRGTDGEFFVHQYNNRVYQYVP